MTVYTDTAINLAYLEEPPTWKVYGPYENVDQGTTWTVEGRFGNDVKLRLAGTEQQIRDACVSAFNCLTDAVALHKADEETRRQAETDQAEAALDHHQFVEESIDGGAF